MEVGITMLDLLSKIPPEYIENISLKSNMSYAGVMMLYHKDIDIEDNIVYIGYTSNMPEYVDSNIHYGLIVINDKQVDFSVYQLDVVELKYDIIISKLYELLKETIYTYEYNTSFSIYKSMIKHNDLNIIIQRTSELLSGNPVILFDDKTNLIAYYTEQEIDDPSANHILTMGYSLPRHISDAHIEGTHKRLDENTMPITVEAGLNKTRRRILGSISINNKAFGNIIVLEYNRKFNSMDVKILSAVCNAISHIIEHQKKVTTKAELADVMFLSYIKSLLDNNEINLIWVDGWLKYMGWYIHQSFYVIIIPELNDEFKIKLENQISCFAIDYEENIVLIINPSNLEEFQSYMKILQKELSYFKYRAGISRQFDDIQEIRVFYRQAKEALRIGVSIRERIINSYSDIAIYDMLISANTKLSISNFYSRELGKLIAYDKQFGTDYYVTFYTFLKCFGSKTISANELFIHRNTMVYRLGRIAEILEIDLFDGEQCFQYYMSYKINDLLRIFENKIN